LTEVFKTQSQKNGCKSISRTVVKVDASSFPYRVIDEKNDEYFTRGVIVATGATAKRLYLPTEERLWQHGISACAVCDGALPIFRKQPVAVIGGGDTAMEEATFLTKFASTVYIIHRRDTFRASKVMVDRVMKNEKIQVIWDSVADDVYGQSKLDGVVVRNVKSNEVTKLPVKGLFYAIGHKPNIDFLKETAVKFDEDGYILTVPGSTKTNVNGLFAGGDVQDKRYRQAMYISTLANIYFRFVCSMSISVSDFDLSSQLVVAAWQHSIWSIG
jgi:thioredoxin reductase (NADPH)